MRAIATITTIVAGTVLLAACSSTPVVKPVQAPVVATAKTDIRTVAPVVAPVAVDPLNDPNSVLAKRSVYFDFDRYNVKSEFSPLISAHSAFLTANSAHTILIQGNTDNRGGSEYNLALGQKRAEAVRKALHLSGTPDAQMEAVSYGKEKPKATGNDEQSWAENRRADIVYVAK